MIRGNIEAVCQNLCDLPFDQLTDILVSMDTLVITETEILIGSYTCGNYFIKMLEKLPCILELAKTEMNLIRLVIPALSQSQYDRASRLLAETTVTLAQLGTPVINDLGGAELCKASFHIPHAGLGRLFFREYRDYRYRDFVDGSQSPPIGRLAEFIHSNIIELVSLEAECSGCQLDFSQVSEQFALYLHYPELLMSYGHICEYASIGKALNRKFRPDMPCGTECFTCASAYDCGEIEYTKVGRGVYFDLTKENINVSGRGFRLVAPFAADRACIWAGE